MTTSPHVPQRTMPLNHPGTVATERRTSISTQCRSKLVTLRPGARLIDAMTETLASLGASSGQFELLDGFLSQIDYCYPALCHDGSAAVSYSQTLTAKVPARVIAGSATVGWRKDEPFAHCHVNWHDANGHERGGHLWPTTTIGPSSIRAVVHALRDVELYSDIDPECRLPVFQPRERSRQAVTPESGRAVMSRLAPGVVVEEAVREIMTEHEFSVASIAGSLGSFVGAVFQRGDSVFLVDGPATEVSFTGEFDIRNRSAPIKRMNGLAIDRHGLVHHGAFILSEAIVACTVELLVREVTW